MNMYEVDEDLMKSLNVKTFVGYSVSWALFVKKNRANRSRNQIHDFDMVVGPIADDDIGLQMRKLNDGRISLDDFMKALQWKRVTIQYFFRNCSLIILGSNIKELPLEITREYYYAGSMINFKDDPVTLDVTHMTSTEAIKVPVKLIAQMIDENIIIQRRQGQKLLIPKVLAESISSYIKTI